MSETPRRVPLCARSLMASGDSPNNVNIGVLIRHSRSDHKRVSSKPACRRDFHPLNFFVFFIARIPKIPGYVLRRVGMKRGKRKNAALHPLTHLVGQLKRFAREALRGSVFVYLTVRSVCCLFIWRRISSQAREMVSPRRSGWSGSLTDCLSE